jgi:hypothetical protein
MRKLRIVVAIVFSKVYPNCKFFYSNLESKTSDPSQTRQLVKGLTVSASTLVSWRAIAGIAPLFRDLPEPTVPTGRSSQLNRHMLTDAEILCFSGYYLVRMERPSTADEGEEKVLRICTLHKLPGKYI